MTPEHPDAASGAVMHPPVAQDPAHHSPDRPARGPLTSAPMLPQPDCVVCRIVAGELDAHVVYRDDHLVAFLDHRPVFPGHVLVCPLVHVPDLNHLDLDLMQPLLALGQRVSLAQQAVLDADGSFVAMNNIVSQSVPHVHLHVVPRRFKDGLRGFFWPRTKYAGGQGGEVAALLRGALAAS